MNASYELGQPSGANAFTSISNGESASYVLGSSSFTSCNSGTTQNTLNEPIELNHDPGSSRLFVVDSGNERVIIFDGGTLPQGDYFNP